MTASLLPSFQMIIDVLLPYFSVTSYGEYYTRKKDGNAGYCDECYHEFNLVYVASSALATDYKINVVPDPIFLCDQ